jgi:hypothetical protein
MWPPLIEKAWAKTIGNYIQADGGFSTNTLHGLTGIPAFEYAFSKKLNSAQAFQLIQVSDLANFIMVINVDEATKCGIREGHAYTLIGAFTMKDK